MKLDWVNSQLSKSDLSELTQQIFKNTDEFQFDLNVYSMSNYSQVFNSLKDILYPNSIAEIGVFNGEFSAYLLNNFDSKFSFVDIEFKNEVKDKIESLAHDKSKEVSFHEERSVDFLSKTSKIDWLFIDGDHNYETVSQELKLIYDSSDRKKIIFLHDTGWPCARRDFSYEPTMLNHKEKYQKNKMVTPFSSSIVDEFGLIFDYCSEVESKDKQGVLTAVEDFLSSHVMFGHIYFNSFYGLSVIWDKSKFSPMENEKIEGILNCSDIFKSFVDKLELNRIMLLIMLNRAGSVWRKQKDYIDFLEKRMDKNG